MPTPATEPGPAGGPRSLLEIFDDEDWVGTLEVGFHQDHLGSYWWWRVSNGMSRLLDSAGKLADNRKPGGASPVVQDRDSGWSGRR